MRPWAGRLAVFGRGRLHDEVAELLPSLRTPGPAAAFATVTVGQPAAPAAHVGDAEAKLALELPEVRLDEVTLQAAFEHLRDAAAANVFVSHREIEALLAMRTKEFAADSPAQTRPAGRRR